MRPLVVTALLLLAVAQAAEAASSFRFERRLPFDAAGSASPAVGPGGVLWTTAGDDDAPYMLQKRDARGRLLLTRRSPYPDELNELAVGPDGALHVGAMFSPVRRFTAAGRPAAGWRTRGAGTPTELTVDGRGRLVAITQVAGQTVVLRLRPDGRLERRLLGEVGELAAEQVAASGSGRVAVLLEDSLTFERSLLVLGADGRPRTPAPVPLRGTRDAQLLLVRDRVVLLRRRSDGRGELVVLTDDGRQVGRPSTGRATTLNEEARVAAGAGGRIVLLDGSQAKVVRLLGP